MERPQQTIKRCLVLVLALTASCRSVADDIEALLFPTDGSQVAQAPIFTAPAPIINVKGTSHSEDLLFTLFRPSSRPLWSGNLKRYRISQRAKADGVTELLLYDATGAVAIDPQTGLFDPDSTSLWTPDHFSPDGADIARGGLASRLYDYQADVPLAGSRKVYTYSGRNPNLSDPSNALHENNIADGIDPEKSLSKNMFAAAELSDDEFVQLVQWARGVDLNDFDGDGDLNEGRLQMGASLHSPPVVVSVLSQDGSQQDLLFAATNAGYLHAALVDTDADTGQLEQFAFVPPDLLPNLKYLEANQTGTGHAGSGHTLRYGLDGALSVWFDDRQQDGVLDPGEDHIYLYISQRRGGRHYYAIEVTDLAAPRLLWVIKGGSDSFEQLGQTWSAPVPARIALQLAGDSKAVVRDVLMFAGGYDPSHDQAGLPRREDSVGRAIYIVDARSGALLWWAGGNGLASIPDKTFDDMRYAIAAPITVIDQNGDGLSDLFTVGDLGGQLWRFDIADGTIAGGVIADLQDPGDGTLSAENNRRFYEAVDIARVRSTRFGEYLAFAVASGYRAHPLDPITQEAVFLLRQIDTDSMPRDSFGQLIYNKITAGDLFDITDQPEMNGDDLNTAELAQYTNGWRLSLRDSATGDFVGEKVLAAPLMAGGLLMFTTYTPDPQPAPEGPGPGRARVYAVAIEDGAPSPEQQVTGSEVGQLKVDDRYLDLTPSGLPPSPVVMFPPFDGAEPVVLVGPVVTGIKLPATIQRTYWYQDRVH